MKFKQNKRGFTLMEILIAVLIIGILGAIALPQYQRAVLKSRFAALMPIAKSLADSNEVYYLDNGEYAEDAEDLPIQGRMNYPDGTTLEFGTSTKYAYVLATNSSVENNKYVVYQKHSENFPGNTHCEALTGDDKAEELCQALGGAYIGENGDFTAYLLSGNGTGGTFEKECTTKPQTTLDCECGQETRDAECNTKTGEWSYGTWSGCPDKPDTSQACSKNGKSGTQTRSVTCGESGWDPGNWGACEIECGTRPSNMPANITTYTTKATGTAQCVEGEWVYTWERKFTGNCSGNNNHDYACAGGLYQQNFTHCDGPSSGNSVVYACAGSIFEGDYAHCSASHQYDCMNTTYTGAQSYCFGNVANGCSGATFAPGTYCYATAAGGCDNTTYQTGEDANGNPTSGCCVSRNGNNCPVGSPKCIEEYVGSNRTARLTGKCWGEGGTEVDCEE